MNIVDDPEGGPFYQSKHSFKGYIGMVYTPTGKTSGLDLSPLGTHYLFSNNHLPSCALHTHVLLPIVFF